MTYHDLIRHYAQMITGNQPTRTMTRFNRCTSIAEGRERRRQRVAARRGYDWRYA